MEGWRADIQTAVDNSTSVDSLFNFAFAYSTNLGFEHCAYGHKAPAPLGAPSIFMLNNYPRDWNNLYVESDYIAIDPTVRHALSSSKAVLWPTCSNASDGHEDVFWRAAREHGLRHGWAIAIHEKGAGVGLMSFSRSTEKISQSELDWKELQMRWLCEAIHSKYCSTFANLALPANDLSFREKEIIRWTADGKSAFEIGCILNISERTVNFHISNVMKKLNSVNKTQSAVKAFIYGLV